MKTFNYISFVFTVMLLVSLSILCSCDKDDEFTIENKAVTGQINHVQTGFIPLTFDSTGMVPLSAQISFDGTGTLTDLGDLHVVSTFKFDFVTGHGFDFDVTFTGTNPDDTFKSGGTSQLQPDGTFIISDTIISGTGKFSKISGGGTSLVTLNQAMNAGTASVTWTVTY